MLKGSGSSFGNGLGKSRGPPVRNQNGSRARRMGGSDYSSQVVRILYTVKKHEELGSSSGQHIVEFDIALHGSEGHHALVRGAMGGAVERVSRFKAQRHGTFTRQIDDLLKTRTARSTRDQKPIERASGAQSFAYRMNAGQQAARLVTLMKLSWFALRNYQSRTWIQPKTTALIEIGYRKNQNAGLVKRPQTNNRKYDRS
jgi:hypothetical protein